MSPYCERLPPGIAPNLRECAVGQQDFALVARGIGMCTNTHAYLASEGLGQDPIRLAQAQELGMLQRYGFPPDTEVSEDAAQREIAHQATQSLGDSLELARMKPRDVSRLIIATSTLRDDKLDDVALTVGIDPSKILVTSGACAGGMMGLQLIADDPHIADRESVAVLAVEAILGSSTNVPDIRLSGQRGPSDRHVMRQLFGAAATTWSFTKNGTLIFGHRLQGITDDGRSDTPTFYIPHQDRVRPKDFSSLAQEVNPESIGWVNTGTRGNVNKLYKHPRGLYIGYRETAQLIPRGEEGAGCLYMYTSNFKDPFNRQPVELTRRLIAELAQRHHLRPDPASGKIHIPRELVGGWSAHPASKAVMVKLFEELDAQLSADFTFDVAVSQISPTDRWQDMPYGNASPASSFNYLAHGLRSGLVPTGVNVIHPYMGAGATFGVMQLKVNV